MENTGQVALAVLPPAPEVPPFHFNFSLFPLNLLQERKPQAGTCHTTPSREEKKDMDRFPSFQDKGVCGGRMISPFTPWCPGMGVIPG